MNPIPAEIHEAFRLLAEHFNTDAEDLPQYLDRSNLTKGQKFYAQKPGGKDRSGARWEKAEDDALVAAWKAGADENVLARIHLRTSGAINSRLRRLDREGNYDLGFQHNSVPCRIPRENLQALVDTMQRVFRGGTATQSDRRKASASHRYPQVDLVLTDAINYYGKAQSDRDTVSRLREGNKALRKENRALRREVGEIALALAGGTPPPADSKDQWNTMATAIHNMHKWIRGKSTRSSLAFRDGVALATHDHVAPEVLRTLSEQRAQETL